MTPIPTQPSPLRFRFNLEKLVNALALFAASGISDLTKLKAAKLLYLADRLHLYKYGRPITGDRYVAMDLGPVPEDAFQLISRLIQPVEVEDEALKVALDRLEVHRGLLHRYKYPILKARTQPDLSVFSDSEVEVLNQVFAEYGRRTARELVDLTHEHLAYKRADKTRAKGSSESLPYEFFFEDAPEDVRDRARCLANFQQESHDFAEALRAAGAKASAESKGRRETTLTSA